MSALLLQLVQTSAHDVRVQARIIRKARRDALALRRQNSLDDTAEEPFLNETDMEVSIHLQFSKLYVNAGCQELRLYSSGLDSATKAARSIVIFLTQRSVSSIASILQVS